MNLSEPETHTDWTDQQCVESSRNGCPEDFRTLVQRYQKPVFAYLSSRIGNTSEVEEATEESFVRAFLSLKSLRKPESFYSWLLGIAGRVAKEHFRSVAKRAREQQAAEAILPDGTSGEEAWTLEQAVQVLPETYRRVIVLRYYEDLSCQEVARRLDMPLGTVTKTLSRAYSLLRQELKARQSAEQTINESKR